MNIDLSKAFDCINRAKLLHVLQEILPKDSYRTIHYLLSTTALQVRIGNNLSEWFSTTIGTPQGDALSPVLFIVYLEAALRHHRATHPPYLQKPLDLITSYADDTNFGSPKLHELQQIETSLPAALNTYNLQMNTSKTEWATISRETSTGNLKVKMLGSHLQDRADISHKTTLARQAFAQHWNTWLNKEYIPLQTKIRLYNACIKPILTYNLSCLGAPYSALRPLATIHRTHLRRMTGINYPKIITNAHLHKITHTHHILLDITQARWALLGHLLRRSKQTPAYRMTLLYFKKNNITPEYPQYHGRRPTSLPTTLDSDLTRINRRLTNIPQLYALRRIAADRTEWSQLQKQIVEAYAKHLDIIEPPSKKTIFTHKPRRPSVLITPPPPPPVAPAAAAAGVPPPPQDTTPPRTQHRHIPIRLVLNSPLTLRISRRTHTTVSNTNRIPSNTHTHNMVHQQEREDPPPPVIPQHHTQDPSNRGHQPRPQRSSKRARQTENTAAQDIRNVRRRRDDG
jgi:hypothetical protein